MSDCVFCDIVAGTAPATIVQDWVHTVIIHPLNPVTPGHLLVITKRHVPDFAAEPLVSGYAMVRAAEFAQEMSGEWNLITSKGQHATQTVRHLHIHLIPRRAGDGLHLPWTGQAAHGE